MNFIVLIILLVQNLGSLTDSITVNNVLFLENNYFTEGINRAEFDNRLLYYVLIETKDFEAKHFKIYTYGTFYFNIEKKKYLCIIDPVMTKDILSAVNPNNKKNEFMKFRYLFCKKGFIGSYFSESSDIIFFEYYENNKKIIKGKGDTIKLADGGHEGYLCHIKEILQELCNLKCFILDDFNADLLDRPQKFTLQHFKTISSCFDNFKKFVLFFNCLKLDCEKSKNVENNNLIENGKHESSSESDSFTILGCGSFVSDSDSVDGGEYPFLCEPNMEINEEPNLIPKEYLLESANNVLKISFIKEFLQINFDKDFKDKKNVDKKIQEFYNNIEYMFKAFRHEIVMTLSSNDIILPIDGIYTVEFYLYKFYELIKNEIEDMLKGYYARQRGADYGDILFRFRLNFKKKIN